MRFAAGARPDIGTLTVRVAAYDANGGLARVDDPDPLGERVLLVESDPQDQAADAHAGPTGRAKAIITLSSEGDWNIDELYVDPYAR